MTQATCCVVSPYSGAYLKGLFLCLVICMPVSGEGQQCTLMSAGYFEGQKRGIRLPAAGVTGGCGPPERVLTTEPQPSAKQQV